MLQWSRGFPGRRSTALNRYTNRLGQLVERRMAHAALVAARQQAEREAGEARQAKMDTELANSALRSEIEVRASTQSRLAHLASHDPLTGLPNRVLLSERISSEMKIAQRHGRRLALLYIDLDNFKDVNDTLGHPVGDALLRQVSDRIKNELRAGETVARMGGDEFAVLQIGPDDAVQARALAERLVVVLGQPFDIEQRPIFISASVGITLFPDDADTMEMLHRNADLAMYEAKSGGRNRCHFFDAALNQAVQRRAFIEQALREPATLAQLSLVFQPQVAVRTRIPTGVEALLRWKHPEQGTITPAEFIGIAEQSGTIVDIGAWVLRESCGQAVRWRNAGMPKLTVAVNVATAQFRGGNMPRLVADVLATTGLPASWLELEITENALMPDTHVVAETLVALHQQGVAIAIDDFGTGYSSLSYLRRLPVDRIKIDRSFVSDVTVSEDAAALAYTIVKLAHNLRLEVVAEGVETRAQADFLLDTGCTFAQGYYYGKPASANHLSGLMARSALLETAL